MLLSYRDVPAVNTTDTAFSQDTVRLNFMLFNHTYIYTTFLYTEQIIDLYILLSLLLSLLNRNKNHRER